MIDPGREIPLQAGDTTYTLYAGNKALRLMERETGISLFELVEKIDSDNVASISMELVTTIVWAMLQSRHPELSIDDTDNIIDAAGYEAVMEALGGAIQAAFPELSQTAASGKVTGRNGTGARSSRARSRRG